MRIQHNIMAMNAYRNYTNNVSAMQKNLEKLSSGYKINRAGDDAAGLAISEKMRAQITGLETAQKNAKDGISLVKTAEGALTEVHDMLNRMVELATQSANGTYDDTTDRTQLQKEVEQLKDEINRIADSSNFNGIQLLDGSMDASAKTKAVDFSDVGVLPGVGSVLGKNTVLHSTAASDNGGSVLSVDLHNTTFANAKAGDTMTLKIGNNTLSLIAGEDTTAGKAMDATAIAQALENKYANDLKIDGQEFSIKAETDGNGDARITFTQKNAPTKASEVVDPSKEVSITGDGISGSFGSKDTQVYGTAGTATTFGTNGKADFSGLDVKKLAEAISAKGLKTEGTDFQISLRLDADENGVDQYQITVNDGTDEIVLGQVAKDSVTLPDDGDPAVELNFGALGTVSIAANGGNVAAPGNNNPIDTGLKFTSEPVELNAQPTDSTITAATAGSNAAKPKATLDLAGIDVDKPCTLTFEIGGKSFDVEVTQDMIDGTLDEEIASALADKLNEVFSTDAAGKFTAETDAGTATQINLEGTNMVDMSKSELNDLFGTGYNVSVKANAGGNSAYADYNKSTTNQKTVTVDNSSNRLASTYWTLDKSMVQDGAKVQIGKQTYTFTSDAAKKDADGFVYIGDLDRGKDSFASDAAQRLTDAAKGNKTWTVGHDGNRMTFTEIKTQGEYAKDGQSTLTTKEEIANTFGYTGVEVVGKGLTLQLGDTNASYNKLTVDIKDMHADSLGIAGIDISTQDGAAAAISKIKDAINNVSDVRGTLGATQNRLDHTINNLSVMTENIQDAESTIRDTDVADEMMAYTKNNILIQSAQAMLAQANQVPQGVLQLLG